MPDSKRPEQTSRTRSGAEDDDSSEFPVEEAPRFF